jgi:hypothetical protein
MAKVRRKISELSELDNTVNRLMSRYFPKLLQNKEAFDIGCRAILKADQKFNGTGNLGGFRTFCFRRSMSVFGEEKRISSVPNEVLDATPSKYEINFNMDLFPFCKKFLSPLQYDIIIDYFVNNMTYLNISVDQNIAKSTVTREFSRALDIISERLDRDTYV